MAVVPSVNFVSNLARAVVRLKALRCCSGTSWEWRAATHMGPDARTSGPNLIQQLLLLLKNSIHHSSERVAVRQKPSH